MRTPFDKIAGSDFGTRSDPEGMAHRDVRHQSRHYQTTTGMSCFANAQGHDENPVRLGSSSRIA
jgi:hypothetical protein